MQHLPKTEILKVLFAANFESGTLTWKINGARGKPREGNLAGHTDATKQKRAVVGINGKRYLRSRILYAMYHDADPYPLVIDHRNGDPTNDAICNLRAVTQAENLQNQDFLRDKKRLLPTGVKIYRRPAKKKFMAAIQIRGRQKSLGYYLTAEEAHAAYLKAFQEIGRGRAMAARK